MLGVWGFPVEVFNGISQVSHHCTRKLIVVDWPIRSLIFNPKLHPLGRWAALHLKSLQCGIAFEAMGQVGKTALCLLICRQAGFRACKTGIF